MTRKPSRLDADESGPVRCAVLGAFSNWAIDLAAYTGLSVVDASLLLDDHLVRGTE